MEPPGPIQSRRPFLPEGRALPPDLLPLVRQLIDTQGNYAHADLIEDLFHTGVKLIRDGATRGDLKILLTSLKELRHAFRVFAPYRAIRKVSIFGSARTRPGEPEYVQAERFANRMARLGYMVITGAGGGIMEAAQGGAGREKSFGVNIRLPQEQKANQTIENDPKLVNFKYFFTRKVVFVKETNAIALFPGGFGTHDEGFESLTLVQTGKTDPIPIVFIDSPGGSYWRDWLQYVEKHLCQRRLVDAEDLSLFKVTDSLDEAIEEIIGFYWNFHSARFVRDEYVVRLQHPVSDALIEELNRDYADVLKDGFFRRSGALQEESDLPLEILALPRLTFPFNRRSMGRLRQLIDRLNRENRGVPCSNEPRATPGSGDASPS